MSDLIEHYRRDAKGGKHFRGLSVLNHRESIAHMVSSHGAQTMLDYGSGAGDQYKPPHELHKEWGIAAPTLYDPAFPGIDVLPSGLFDGVICSGVLEHVPENDVPAFISRLFSYATAFVWASVCCRPAQKTFPDGTNLHVTVRPMEWWRWQFNKAHPGASAFMLEEAP